MHLHDDDTPIQSTVPSFDGFVLENCNCVEVCQLNAEPMSILPVRLQPDEPARDQEALLANTVPASPSQSETGQESPEVVPTPQALYKDSDACDNLLQQEAVLQRLDFDGS